VTSSQPPKVVLVTTVESLILFWRSRSSAGMCARGFLQDMRDQCDRAIALTSQKPIEPPESWEIPKLDDPQRKQLPKIV
jgi:hypothetical protein